MGRSLLTLELYQSERNTKFIPVIFLESDRRYIPRILSDSTCYDLSSASGYDRLYRHLTAQPLVRKPALGRRIELAHQESQGIGDAIQDASSAAMSGTVQIQLEDAYNRRAKLNEEGGDVTLVQQEIIQLRRRQREGLKLGVNDHLLDGRFRLVDRVGYGGFATVWKAYDRKHPGFVAVKILHGQYAHDRSRQSASSVALVVWRSCSIQESCGLSTSNLKTMGIISSMMEYLSGGDLRGAVLSGRLHRRAL